MTAPELSKQSLGTGYVVATGVVLSLALLAHAYQAFGAGLTGLLVIAAGLVPAASLAGANYWLPRSGLEGEQVWTVAQWGGLGVALLTLVNVAALAVGPNTSLMPAVLASSVAISGCSGALLGAFLELRRSRRRLAQRNDVLNRVLRHDVRNNLNVMLGHLTALEGETDDAADQVAELQQAVDELLRTTEKARQFDVAFAADSRAQHSVDIVPRLEEQAAAIRRAHPDATVDLSTPPEAPVFADWLLEPALDNVIENAIVHGDDPHVEITVDVTGDTVRVAVADEGPAIPDTELDVFARGRETPLDHSSGVGLWLVTSVVESYDGEVSFGTTADGGNVVTLEFQRANRLGGTGWLTWFVRRVGPSRIDSLDRPDRP